MLTKVYFNKTSLYDNNLKNIVQYSIIFALEKKVLYERDNIKEV